MTEGRRQLAAKIDLALTKFSEQLDADILEGMMAWTADKPWDMRFEDVVAKFAREPALPVTAANFLLFMGESVESAAQYARSSRWKNVKARINQARFAAQSTDAKKEYARQLIANEEYARSNAKTNEAMIARYTAAPENQNRYAIDEPRFPAEQQMRILEPDGTTRTIRIPSAYTPARINRAYDTRPIEKPKPQLPVLGAPRAYFND